MGNYRFNDEAYKKKQSPAGLRGIGCLMTILLPMISYIAAVELLKIIEVQSFFYAISPSLFGVPSIPQPLMEIKSIQPLLYKISSWANLEAHILFGLAILLALSGTISLVYAIVYRAIAPPRYGALDAPPQKHRDTKKSR